MRVLSDLNLHGEGRDYSSVSVWLVIFLITMISSREIQSRKSYFSCLTGIIITDNYKRIVFVNFYKIVFPSIILSGCPTEDRLRNRIL